MVTQRAAVNAKDVSAKIFSFARSGDEVKRGIEVRNSTRNVSTIWQKVGNRVSKH